jgi:hypothetical protein
LVDSPNSSNTVSACAPAADQMDHDGATAAVNSGDVMKIDLQMIEAVD